MGFAIVQRLVAPLLCSMLFASPSHAFDWFAKTRLSETVDISDNLFLSRNPSGEAYRTLSAINLDLLARTPLTRYALNGGFSYFSVLGPGADDTAQTFGKQNFVRFDTERAGKLPGDRTNFGAGWRRSDVISSQLADTGLTTADRGNVDVYDVDGGLRRQLSENDSAFVTARAARSEFTDSAPLLAFSSTSGWTHRLSPVTSANVSASYSFSTRENGTSNKTETWQAMTGVQTQWIKGLNVKANAGAIFTNIVGPTSANLSEIPVLSGGRAVGFVADVAVSYKLFPTTIVNFSAVRSVSPTTFGDLSQRTSFTASVDQLINHVSSLSFIAQISEFSGSGQGSTATEFFSASAIYSRRLDKDWTGRLSYTYRQRSGDFDATSNSVLISVGRDVVLLP